MAYKLAVFETLAYITQQRYPYI